MNFVSAIVLAAGRGERFGSVISKPLIKVKGVPILIYSLRVLEKAPEIKEIIVTVNPLNHRQIRRQIRRYRLSKVKSLVLGGRERQDSVRNALRHIDQRADLVLIHDSARPFIDGSLVSAVVREAKEKRAAIPAVPVKATIKQVNAKRTVVRTLKRNNLWEVQTPQVFSRELIQRAYEKFSRHKVTDDSSLVEKLGRKVFITRGSYFNLKITTREDLSVAEIIAGKIKRG